MDVRLPDGTVIKNVPDGTTKADLVARLEKNGYDTSGLMAKPTPVKIGAEGLPDAIAEASKDFSAPSKFAVGAAGAINDMAMRLKQLLGGKLTTEQTQGIQEYRALNQASPAALTGDIGMNVLSTAIPGVGLQGAATNLAAKVAPAFLAPTLGAAAAGGGLAAATEPVPS